MTPLTDEAIEKIRERWELGCMEGSCRLEDPCMPCDAKDQNGHDDIAALLAKLDQLQAELAYTPPTLEFITSVVGEPDRIDDENQHDVLIWKCGIEWHAGHCFCCRVGNGERLRTRAAVLAAVAKSA